MALKEHSEQLSKYLDETYTSNMLLLKEHDPVLHAVLQAYNGPRNYSIEPLVKDGRFVDIKINLPSGSFNCFSKSESDGTNQPLLDITEDGGIIAIFDAIIEEHTLLTVFEATNNIRWSIPNSRMKPIYVIEHDVARVLLFFSVYSVPGILTSHRVFFFVGTDATSSFCSFIKKPGTQYPSSIFSRKNNERVLLLDKTLDLMKKKSLSIQYHLIEQNSKFYSSMTLENWLNIYSMNRSRPIRVLGITSLFTSALQFCMRDWLAGFSEYGCETDLLIEKDKTSIMDGRMILDTINNFKPDLILLLDHYRYELGAHLPIYVPVISWIQDILEDTVEYTGTEIDRNNYVYSLSKTWIKEGIFSTAKFRDCKIRHLPTGINPGVYQRLPEINKDIDVLYVSHLGSPSRTMAPFHSNYPYIDWFEYETKLIKEGSITIDELKLIYVNTSKAINRLPLPSLLGVLKIPDESRTFARTVLEASNIYPEEHLISLFTVSTPNRFNYEVACSIKARPLLALSEKQTNMRIYGNHWDIMHGLKKFSKGPSENGYFLNRLMNRTKICINNSAGTSMHMRALEILGSGSFMLSRYIPPELDNADLREHFIEDEEIIFFSDEKDLCQKVTYYLSDDHKEEREEIAWRAHKKAVSLLSYKAIAEKLIADVYEGFKQG